ncbi:MAG: toprim domain-containing protein [Acidihalobacter sp.]|uniref:toprim domain-containing protein n=1 Tax=Acidihalobacter sp. TaxID=1872108 RepID=UPI00307CCB78
MTTAHDPEELRRFTRDIPLPAYLASRGYTARPDPRYRNALLLLSPGGREALSVSQKGGVWLYNDRYDPQNKGTIVNWAQRHGAANLGKVRAGLRPILGDDKRLGDLKALQNVLQQSADIERQEAGRAELEAFVRDIPLPAFLEKHSYAFDAKESSRNSLKFRGEAGVLLVSRQRDGAWVYWNATDDRDKGTITQFCRNNLGAASLGEARRMLRPELGGAADWTPPASVRAREGRSAEAQDMLDAWGKLPGIYLKDADPGRYYLNGRGINRTIGRFEDAIRAEPVQGHVNVAVAHYQFRDGEDQPRLTGWERKGPGRGGRSFSGFSGHRGLALLGKPEDGYTLVLCESGIDALSRAELDAAYAPNEYLRSVYASTGGAPGQASDRTLRELVERHPPAGIAIALDGDQPGRTGVRPGREMTGHLLAVVRETGTTAAVRIDQPRDKKDWNEQLQFHKERGELDMPELQHGRPDRISLPIESDRSVDWDAVQAALDAPWPPAARTQTPGLSLEEDSPPRLRNPQTLYTVHQAPGEAVHRSASLATAAQAWAQADHERFPILHRQGPNDVDASGDPRPRRLAWVEPDTRERRMDRDAVSASDERQALADALAQAQERDARQQATEREDACAAARRPDPQEHEIAGEDLGMER